MSAAVISLFFASLSPSPDYVYPNPQLTPGAFCTDQDPDFKEYRYNDHVPICERNVSKVEKLEVLRNYGIPAQDQPKYEMDHCISLGMGGSNDISNIWPQPRDATNNEAKNQVEDRVFQNLRDGVITYAEAVTEMRKWCPAP